jgi:hypothetical protein
VCGGFDRNVKKGVLGRRLLLCHGNVKDFRAVRKWKVAWASLIFVTQCKVTL